MIHSATLDSIFETECAYEYVHTRWQHLSWTNCPCRLTKPGPVLVRAFQPTGRKLTVARLQPAIDPGPLHWATGAACSRATGGVRPTRLSMDPKDAACVPHHRDQQTATVTLRGTCAKRVLFVSVRGFEPSPRPAPGTYRPHFSRGCVYGLGWNCWKWARGVQWPFSGRLGLRNVV